MTSLKVRRVEEERQPEGETYGECRSKENGHMLIITRFVRAPHADGGEYVNR